MSQYRSVTTAVGLIALGNLLNAAIRLHAGSDGQMNLHFAAVLVGQACWVAAMFLLLVWGNAYASERFSYDGPALPIFNTVKWALVTVFLLYDAFVLERVWEWYVIMR